MTLKRIFTLPFLLIFSLLVWGCNSGNRISKQNAGTREMVYSHRWMLNELYGIPVKTARTPYITFTAGDADRIFGFAGCNQFKGVFRLGDDHSIVLSRTMLTRMACPDSIESAFMAMIDSCNRWSVTESSLVLKHEKNILARFVSAEDGSRLPGNNPLLNKQNWSLYFIGGPPANFDSLFPKAKPWLKFQIADSTYVGFSGCNSFRGKFTAEKNSIRFNPPAATERACPGNGEQRFMGMLQRVTRYEATNDSTLLLSDESAVLLKFRRQ